MARPSDYTKDLAQKICKRLAGGESLRHICLDDDMPAATTVHQWVLEDKKESIDNKQEVGFSKQYAQARDIQAEVMFDEILDIADESDNVVLQGEEKKSSAYAQNQKLRVEARKWYLSKVLPKKFGDKLDVTSDGKSIVTVTKYANGDQPTPSLQAEKLPDSSVGGV